MSERFPGAVDRKHLSWGSKCEKFIFRFGLASIQKWSIYSSTRSASAGLTAMRYTALANTVRTYEWIEFITSFFPIPLWFPVAWFQYRKLRSFLLLNAMMRGFKLTAHWHWQIPIWIKRRDGSSYCKHLAAKVWLIQRYSRAAALVEYLGAWNCRSSLQLGVYYLAARKRKPARFGAFPNYLVSAFDWFSIETHERKSGLSAQ